MYKYEKGDVCLYAHVCMLDHSSLYCLSAVLWTSLRSPPSLRVRCRALRMGTLNLLLNINCESCQMCNTAKIMLQYTSTTLLSIKGWLCEPQSDILPYGK